jgi:sirohydrochlorin cobaltochelatase
MKRGLLLFAHGARDARWSEPFEKVADHIRGVDPALVVELAFLEFMAPTLLEAGSRLLAAGCATVDVVPLFLGTGGHVRRDLPALMAQLSEAHPEVAWRLHAAIGEVPSVIAAMAQAALRFVDAPAAPT